MIILEHVNKTFHDGDTDTEILRDISLKIETGEKVAIVGRSGSGKSTLLSIMSGLDAPTRGKVIVDGVDIYALDEKDISVFRNKKSSIIFQSFELIQFFTAFENVALPLSIRGEKMDKKNTDMIDQMFANIGLTHRKHNIPSKLSGGEQQRVAIARVLVSGSDIIFADEPTGNLDTENGNNVLHLLLESVKNTHKTLVLITHDMQIAKQMDRIYSIENGNLIEQHG
jgi:putative ABC transport system ATP-binding protein